MAIHPQFPISPYEIILPEYRWFPADETLRDTSYEKLIPPLVHTLRKNVFEWRKNGYPNVSETTATLLNWWFKENINIDKREDPFDYYFAQRESVETIIYLYENVKVSDKNDLLKFDNLGVINARQIEETWRRFVIKMATGSGKTKVISLLLVWSYFHKKYENGSDLSTNFLIIAPNIIVLDRLKNDFDGLRIFNQDPILPRNGVGHKNWKSDFQISVHIQDDIGTINPLGNIFLTNIHRVFEQKENLRNEEDYSLDFYW